PRHFFAGLGVDTLVADASVVARIEHAEGNVGLAFAGHQRDGDVEQPEGERAGPDGTGHGAASVQDGRVVAHAVGSAELRHLPAGAGVAADLRPRQRRTAADLAPFIGHALFHVVPAGTGIQHVGFLAEYARTRAAFVLQDGTGMLKSDDHRAAPLLGAITAALPWPSRER